MITKDGVMAYLFNVGIYNWSNPKICGPEGICSIQYVAILGHQLFKMICGESDKVCQIDKVFLTIADLVIACAYRMSHQQVFHCSGVRHWLAQHH